MNSTITYKGQAARLIGTPDPDPRCAVLIVLEADPDTLIYAQRRDIAGL